MAHRIDDLSLNDLMHLFQAMTEPHPREGVGTWSVDRPTPGALVSESEGAAFEKVLVPSPGRSLESTPMADPVPMDDADDEASGVWLWFEH